MPVLEITCLRSKRLVAGDHDLLKSLSSVRDKLQTNSQFYGCIQDPTLIFILGMWPDLDAHLAFLSSPAREEVLAPQDDMLAFQWTAHMKLDEMNSLPLDASVLAIESYAVEGNCNKDFEQAMVKHAEFVKASQPFKVVSGWRIDAIPLTHEALILSGWQHEQQHISFAGKQNDLGNGERADIRYIELFVHHARNLE